MTTSRPLGRYLSLAALAVVVLAVPLLASGCKARVERLPAGAVDQELELIRQAVVARFGELEGTPRVNLGPCGPFAKLFREEWNARFAEPVEIGFALSFDGNRSFHVFVRLPDGRFFDGGRGVVDAQGMMRDYESGSVLVLMDPFDLDTLDRYSYGLVRDYPGCPAWDEAWARELVRTHLDALAARAR